MPVLFDSKGVFERYSRDFINDVIILVSLAYVLSAQYLNCAVNLTRVWFPEIWDWFLQWIFRSHSHVSDNFSCLLQRMYCNPSQTTLVGRFLLLRIALYDLICTLECSAFSSALSASLNTFFSNLISFRCSWYSCLCLYYSFKKGRENTTMKSILQNIPLLWVSLLLYWWQYLEWATRRRIFFLWYRFSLLVRRVG